MNNILEIKKKIKINACVVLNMCADGGTMKFIETKHLKQGMRLAHPIYSNAGAMLFDRNSKLTRQAIDSVVKFGLLGVYVLEPAEPAPPITAEDLEFERFQTMTVFSIQEELRHIIDNKKQNKMPVIVANIIKKYGYIDGKINFYQNLRGRNDFVYKHSLNVAILSAMLTKAMNIRLDEQQQTIIAALVHDIGKIAISSELVDSDEMTPEAQRKLLLAQNSGFDIIEYGLSEGKKILRICMQASKLQTHQSIGDGKVMDGANILLVANRYDEITSMKLGGDSGSEVTAIKEFLDHPQVYNQAVVNALISCINILTPGIGVELNTGEEALVVVENTQNILRPVVLSFRDNTIIDLSLAFNKDIHIIDIMKTLDNRYVMDMDTLNKVGF